MKLKTNLVILLLITIGILSSKTVVAQRRSSPSQPSQPSAPSVPNQPSVPSQPNQPNQPNQPAPSFPPPVNGAPQVPPPLLPNPQPPVAPNPQIPTPQPDVPILRDDNQARTGKIPMNPPINGQQGLRTNAFRSTNRRPQTMTNFPPALTNRIPSLTNSAPPMTNRVPPLRLTNHME